MNISLQDISLKNLAGYISHELENVGISLYLVGGACVTIYSHNKYQSHDLDFITYGDLRKVKKTLESIGFIYKSGYFQHPKCPWIIEFVIPPVAIGNELIDSFSALKTEFGTIQMLTAEDCIKDRLAGYFHWSDRQSLDQAVHVYFSCRWVNLSKIKLWAEKEGYKKKYLDFVQAVGITQKDI